MIQSEDFLTAQNILGLIYILASVIALAIGWWMGRMQMQVDKNVEKMAKYELDFEKYKKDTAIELEAYKLSSAVAFEAYKATVPTRTELTVWFENTDALLAKQDEKLTSLMQMFYEKLSSKQDK